ncbi:hypothetical protein [Methylogaea oryzae]|uniref:hypothetical protein n=1 Tax=Methylogaea oryzae TaxID=1295382 RepID=UPI001C7ED999|nr:hypothetical protein [Methylogaea oryzae]
MPEADELSALRCTTAVSLGCRRSKAALAAEAVVAFRALVLWLVMAARITYALGNPLPRHVEDFRLGKYRFLSMVPIAMVSRASNITISDAS